MPVLAPLAHRVNRWCGENRDYLHAEGLRFALPALTQALREVFAHGAMYRRSEADWNAKAASWRDHLSTLTNEELIP